MIVQPFHLAKPMGHKATLVFLYLAILSDLTLEEVSVPRTVLPFGRSACTDTPLLIYHSFLSLALPSNATTRCSLGLREWLMALQREDS